MDKKTGVQVKKTKFADKKVSTDLTKVFTSLCKLGVSYATSNPTSAGKDFVSVLDAFKFSPDPSDLAYNLVLTALVNSAHNLAKENSHRIAARFRDLEELYDDGEYLKFLDGITGLVEKEALVLEFEMLKDPRSIPILDGFKGYFCKYLVLFGISTKESELISNRLPTYFVFALNDEWRSNFSKYEPIIQNLNAPTAEAARKERQWEAYYTYLEKEVEMHVFGESFSLKDIFIPLRAFHTRKKETPDRGKRIEKVVVDLESVLDDWLESSRPEDTLKVIQGGPGSGKSSFVKWWTAKIAKDRGIPVLFFPLHHFNIHTNIKAAIGEYFKDAPHIPLEFNPVEEPKDNEKMLLIFDGLDELVMQGKSSQESANAFIQELKDFCQLKNVGKQRLQVLVTGRPIAVQDTEAKFRDGAEQILFLLPYYLDEEHRSEYKDENKLLATDYRNQWWNRFFVFKELPNHGLPRELSNDNMDKITAEPLLNYLVALSWMEAPEKFKEDININDVYEQLILGVYNRDWENHRKYKGLGDLNPDDFIQILEEIAICAWQGGDARVTTERKIEKHIDKRGLKPTLDAYKASAEGGGVSRLLTAFYFRKFGKEDSEDKDDTFEFTHKSFGEYLAARAIVELIKATHEEREENKLIANSRRGKRKGWTIEESLAEWLRMTGKNAIDEAIHDFVINEIAIRKKAGEPIEQWQLTLCEIISELVHTGMPLHHLEQRTYHLEETKMARNSEEALLVALSSCARVTGRVSEIDWGGSGSSQFSVWLNRLSSSVSNDDYAFENLNKLNLSHANMSQANLCEADFKDSIFESAVFMFSNLVGADFRRADLRGASLIRANLSIADLTEANLTEAYLLDASFENANLVEANLTGANLLGANLTGADLTGADLTGADLTGADFTRANLTGANLTGADLTGANFREAELFDFNLSEPELFEMVKETMSNTIGCTKATFDKRIAQIIEKA